MICMICFVKKDESAERVVLILNTCRAWNEQKAMLPYCGTLIRPKKGRAVAVSSKKPCSVLGCKAYNFFKY